MHMFNTSTGRLNSFVLIDVPAAFGLAFAVQPYKFRGLQLLQWCPISMPRSKVVIGAWLSTA